MREKLQIESSLDERKERLSRPAYFLSLEVENVRSFGPKQTLDLSNGEGRPAQWTIILGDNGVGKTTILQSLIAALPIEGLSDKRKMVRGLVIYKADSKWNASRRGSSELENIDERLKGLLEGVH
ncbi:MAG: AAA family ATPase, partial [Acidobacteria bacterium]|nr:AAA family ATPase [Acidobacteriota bacterium]MCA1643243.1 AAA family ATPase [Acidobacteriota bacterium]